MPRKISFLPQAFADFNYWGQVDRKVQKKIVALLQEIDRTPFAGTGKPEPLKHQLQGFWSRRITQEHRLVYQVSEDEISVFSCRLHY
ncbi:Txe/YoeB family addiction module toxin [Magnetovirga frankeli]|uniref:Txe/YoeB family addiction module toxin n=1 Tax=Magnetovirga frankeli TaxID=947516 RepID=UPI001292FDD5|nr:Txe/YoeB family addiction module toxin [gamma proteobacterium SS-5]